jgi:hypothetical protein
MRLTRTRWTADKFTDLDHTKFHGMYVLESKIPTNFLLYMPYQTWTPVFNE